MPTNNANVGITYIDANTPPLTPSDDEVYFCKQSESIWVGDTQHSIGPLEHDITTYSFDDGIDSYFKKVVSSIVPVQAGSGTPSPTNVRAISGFTECVVKDFGNNFMPQKDVSVPDTQTNVAINLNLPKGTYTISANISTDGSDTSFRYNIRLNNIAYVNGFLDTSGGRASSTFTIDQDCNQVYLYGGTSSLTQANTTYTDIQIEREAQQPPTIPLM